MAEKTKTNKKHPKSPHGENRTGDSLPETRGGAAPPCLLMPRPCLALRKRFFFSSVKPARASLCSDGGGGPRLLPTDAETGGNEANLLG